MLSSWMHACKDMIWSKWLNRMECSEIEIMRWLSIQPKWPNLSYDKLLWTYSMIRSKSSSRQKIKQLLICWLRWNLPISWLRRSLVASNFKDGDVTGRLKFKKWTRFVNSRAQYFSPNLTHESFCFLHIFLLCTFLLLWFLAYSTFNFLDFFYL